MHFFFNSGRYLIKLVIHFYFRKFSEMRVVVGGLELSKQNFTASLEKS